MDWWAFMWIGISLAIFISVLESIHRNTRRKRAAAREQELQAQLRGQQFHVYTIPSSGTTINQQGIMVHQQQMRADDLPPKYEEVILQASDRNKTTVC